MTVAALIVVMATVFRIRWRITIYLLELGFRVMLLSAFFARSGVRRPIALPARALGSVASSFDPSVLLVGPSGPEGILESQPDREKTGV